MYITHSKNKRNGVSVRLCDNRLPYAQGGKGGGGRGEREGGRGTNYASRRFFLSIHASRTSRKKKYSINYDNRYAIII